jgi:hypothetical protein
MKHFFLKIKIYLITWWKKNIIDEVPKDLEDYF